MIYKLNLTYLHLGVAIDECLRVNWPAVSITPKLHMLENYILPFLERWNAGCGFYGEQGGESIHQVFKKIKHRYVPIKNGVIRLKHTMEEHLRTISPIGSALITKKRKRNETI